MAVVVAVAVPVVVVAAVVCVLIARLPEEISKHATEVMRMLAQKKCEVPTFLIDLLNKMKAAGEQEGKAKGAGQKK